MRTVRVAQLSDTHFLEADASPEGGFAYDTSEAFDAVYAHLEADEAFDLVAVTGDIADHGRVAQYRQAAEAFATLSAPVNICLGNHDQHAAFTTSVARPNVGTSRAIDLGNWCFLFADSNTGVMVDDGSGHLIDPENYDDRLHANGSLGQREASWLREMCATTTADHVFVWVHHPPAPTSGLSADEAYEAEWRTLIGDLTNVRGIGGGHTHIPDQYTFENVPVFVAPALKNNFDLDAQTMLPPGYRTYEFADDGTISSTVQLTDDPRWPRHPLGRAVTSLLRGELTWAEFDEIVARKQARS